MKWSTDHLLSLQKADGCWEGEMVWCTMILSQYVIVQHLAGRGWDEQVRQGIIRYYRVTRTKDGAWGLHRESAGYVFTTTLAYVALRLLGMSADDPLAADARSWLHRQPGGVLANPTWGKFWLALIGLYEYRGVNPCLPELFILPSWLPFHPRKYYCHTRYIYLGIAYLYGCRFVGDLGSLRDELRRELYPQPYDHIDFAAHRHHVAESDLYVRPAALLRGAFELLSYFDRHHISALRHRALDYCFQRILYEQRTTRHQGLSPVNGLLNCLSILARDRHHPDLAPSLAGLESWKWEDEAEGIRYAGARSHTWDTALAMQALLAARQLSTEGRQAALDGYHYLAEAQLTSEIAAWKSEGRDPVLGGWCFSDGAHRWPVSDCSAEALVALLAVHDHPDIHLSAREKVSDERLQWAAAFILSRQNDDGGFGTYERRRGAGFLDNLNPSEMYGACMTERSYLECTSSALKALAHFRSAFPNAMPARIERAIRRGVSFLCRQQRADGSWPGFWGVHFTYAVFHVVLGLRAAGLSAGKPHLGKAADWLVAAQHADGGWGEHYSACLHGRFVDRPSQVVQTSWALLALLEILPLDAEPISRAVAWLKSQQRPDGSLEQQGVTGVFFGTAMLDYRLYAAYFPTWALGRYLALKTG